MDTGGGFHTRSDGFGVGRGTDSGSLVFTAWCFLSPLNILMLGVVNAEDSALLTRRHQLSIKMCGSVYIYFVIN